MFVPLPVATVRTALLLKVFSTQSFYDTGFVLAGTVPPGKEVHQQTLGTDDVYFLKHPAGEEALSVLANVR